MSCDRMKTFFFTIFYHVFIISEKRGRMFKILFLSSKCFTSELICTNRVHPHYRSIAMASVSDIKVGLVDWFVSLISSYDRSDWMEIGEICDGQLDTATSTLGPQSSDQNITLFFSCSKLSFNFPWQHGIYTYFIFLYQNIDFHCLSHTIN